MKKLGIAVGALFLLVVAVGAYVWFSGGSGEPSTEVTAPPVTTAADTAPEDEDSGAETVATEETPPAATSESTTPAGAGAQVVYRIDKEESSVRFEIDEILNGSPKRVVGTTNEVAGEVLVDFDDPKSSLLGNVVINVRTLMTDSSFRDRAMRGPILDSASDENEFATFEPGVIDGFPDQVAVGDMVRLSVSGDLTLSGVKRPVEFDLEIVVVSNDRIEVSGTAMVLRSDFGLEIPNVPSVSDVDDEILLGIDLVLWATAS